LYDSVITPDDFDNVEEKFRLLLDSSYPWHTLLVQIQNQKILEALYRENACYSRAKKILEQELKKLVVTSRSVG
jgi:hypothetical protein